MFKKKQTKPKALKKRTTTDDEEEDETVSASVHAVKRRRQVLNGLQYKRGVNATALGSQKKTTATDAAADAEEEDDSKLPSNTKMTNESQVWKERHQKAMEEYIEKKLKETTSSDETTTRNDDETQEKIPTSITSKDQLYQELAATAQQLSGKTSSSMEQDETSNKNLQHQEVLRSGAATAMAEVILPPSHHTKSPSQLPQRKLTMRKVEQPPVANGRIGFAAARGLQEMNKPREPSADEKAYKNFVQRQRR